MGAEGKDREDVQSFREGTHITAGIYSHPNHACNSPFRKALLSRGKTQPKEGLDLVTSIYDPDHFISNPLTCPGMGENRVSFSRLNFREIYSLAFLGNLFPGALKDRYSCQIFL